MNTEITIPPEYWNKRKRCITQNHPEKFGKVQGLNDELTKMARLAEDLIAIGDKRNVTDKGLFLKEVFKPGLNVSTLEENDKGVVEAATLKSTKKVNFDFFFQVDDYIKSKEKKSVPGHDKSV